MKDWIFQNWWHILCATTPSISKTNDFWMEKFCKNSGFSIETLMLEKNGLFGKKKIATSRRIKKSCACWHSFIVGSQIGKFQQKWLWSYIVIFDPAETRRAKKTANKKLNKKQILTFRVEPSLKWRNFFQLDGKRELFSVPRYKIEKIIFVSTTSEK